MSYPKVLVGTPITVAKDYKLYCLNEYLNTLSQLSYPNMQSILLLNGQGGDDLATKHPQLNFVRTPTKETAVETVVIARNEMRRQVLENGYEYLLFLEQDIIPPLDIVQKLIKLKKTVCSALYFNELKPEETRYAVDKDCFPMLWNFNQKALKKGWFTEELIDNSVLTQNQLLKVDVCGLAVVLIHRSILSEIEFRFDPEHPDIYEEFFFGRDCHMKDIDIFVDCSLTCKHYSQRGLEPLNLLNTY